MRPARRVLVTTTAVLALLVSTATAGSAAAGADSLPAPVLEAIDAGIPYEELTPAQRAAVDAYLKVAESVVVHEDLQRDVVAERALWSRDLPPSTVLSTSCWVGRAIGADKALAGNTLYTYFVEGRWCHSGSTVISAQYEWANGETSTPGWSYHGVQQTGRGISANQARIWAKHKFQLKVGFVTVQTTHPCIRLRGYAFGGAAGDYVCSVT